MIELYNRYIIPKDDYYESEITFVESFDDFDKNFLNRDEYWVKFKNEYKKFTGLYQMDIPAINFFGNTKKEFEKKHNDKIENVQCALRHYVYIMIMDDKRNPQLNGKIILFRYGRIVHDILNNRKNNIFSKIFLLKIRMTNGFQNFDDSKFTDNNYYVRNVTLDINKNIPSLNNLDLTIKNIERRNKLNQITKKMIENEKICM